MHNILKSYFRIKKLALFILKIFQDIWSFDSTAFSKGKPALPTFPLPALW